MVIVICPKLPEEGGQPDLLVVWSTSIHQPLAWGSVDLVRNTLINDFDRAPRCVDAMIEEAISRGSSAPVYEAAGAAGRGPAWFGYDDPAPLRYRNAEVARERIDQLCRILDAGHKVAATKIGRLPRQPESAGDTSVTGNDHPESDHRAAGDGIKRPHPVPTPPKTILTATPPRITIDLDARRFDDHPADAIVDGLTIAGRVVGLAEHYGYKLEDIAATVRQPETTWPSHTRAGTVHLGSKIAAVTAAESGDVVAITTRERAIWERQQPTEAVNRPSGGKAGTKLPTSIQELLTRARHAGLDVIDDRRHYVLRAPGCDRQVTLAKTPSDHHAVKNVATTIRRELGVDLRED